MGTRFYIRSSDRLFGNPETYGEFKYRIRTEEKAIRRSRKNKNKQKKPHGRR